MAPKVLKEKTERGKIEPYINRLKNAIDASEINNVALTGSYGSGKSTILKTFEWLYSDEYEFLKISLASFQDKRERPPDDDFDKRLEVSILQQMFYHVDPSKIPDSRFKRIINLKGKDLFWQSLFVVFWVFSLIAFFKFGYLGKLNPMFWSLDKSLDPIALILSAIFFWGIGLFAKSAYRLLRNSKISKLNIKGELEIGEKDDKSIFNHHLEEIIYFFERTAYNVVFIEDLDRFGSTDIFTKLREINILLNASEQIGREIKFIYAIGDDIFSDKNERVKFFEYIIPVIPFINSSNANEQLERLITEANLQGELSPEFTSDIVTFIDDIDMRLLLNIFHEFQLYKSVLSEGLDPNKLFAIITYKNLDPEDFSKLGKREGKLYSFLSSKESLVKDSISVLQKEVEDIDHQIEQIEGEFERTVKELRIVYLATLASKVNGFISFNLDGQVSIIEAAEDKHFEALRSSKSISYYYSLNGYRNLTNSIPSTTFDKVEKEIDPARSYTEREEILISKRNNKNDELKSAKANLKVRINGINQLSFVELFKVLDAEKMVSSFKDNLLLRNLLINGYINEEYEDYISLFHEIRVTREDHVFERNVKAGVESGFDYKLSKVKELVKNINPRHFSRSYILNFQILDFLLEEEGENDQKRDLFLGLFDQYEEDSYDFVIQFFGREESDIARFLSLICSRNKEFYKNLVEHHYPESGLIYVIFNLFEYVPLEDVLKLEDLDSLEKLLSQSVESVKVFSELNKNRGLKNLCSFIEKRSMIFQKLTIPENEDNGLLKFIFEKSYYSLNPSNIKVLLDYNKVEYKEDNLSNSYYTHLMEVAPKIMLDDIEINLDIFVEDCLLKITTNSKESEEVIIKIIDGQTLELKSKEKFLLTQENLVNDLSKISDDEIKRILVSQNKLRPSWENVFVYWRTLEDSQFDDVLLNYLNLSDVHSFLKESALTETLDVDDDRLERFTETLILENRLIIESYKSLLQIVSFSYPNLEIENLDRPKVEALIDEGILSLTPDNFSNLKNYFFGLRLRLVEKWPQDFIKDILQFTLSTADWIDFLNSPKFSSTQKAIICENIDGTLIQAEEKLARTIFLNLQKMDRAAFNSPTLIKLFTSVEDIEEMEEKVDNLNLYFNKLSDQEVKEIMETFESDYKKILKAYKRPKIARTSRNLILLTELKERGMIKSFKEEDDKYRVIAKQSE